MRSIGVTGHQKAPQSAWDLLSERLPAILGDPPFLGVSSLAAGADQRFAATVLDLGGQLHVVVPSQRYREAFEEPEDRQRFDDMLAAATEVEKLPFEEPSEEAFWAGGKRVVDLCEVLVALWDGQPAHGKGGTADIVDYARGLGRPVVALWPPGASR